MVPLVNSYSKDSQFFLVGSFFFLIDFLLSDTVYGIKPAFKAYHSRPSANNATNMHIDSYSTVLLSDFSFLPIP